MSISLKILGWFSNLGADVDANNALKVNLPAAPADAGHVKVVLANDSLIEGTEDGHVLVSEDTVILFDQIDGSALNTNLWTTEVSGMTITQTGGFINLNAAAAVTANAYAILKTIKSIPLYPEFPIFVAFDLKLNVQPQANITIEFGFGNPSAAAAITDGVFYRLSPDGSFRGVCVNTSVETQGEDFTAVSSNEMHDFDILVEVDDANFEIDDDQEVTIDNPPGIPFSTGITRLPLFIRIINGSSAPAAAPQVSIGRVAVIQKVLRPNKLWGELLAAMGRSWHQSPVTPFTQSANHANSASPASATLSNTAAGYTTLGGRYQFAAPAGAATDFALFAFQVPAGYQFVLSGITISAVNLGAIVAVTPTVLDWSLGVNSSAVSLATAESPPASWAPRRIPLGVQSFVATAAIGAQAQDILRQFFTPVVIDGGRFIHVIVQIPVGTATVSQIIRGDVQLNGYFE